VIPNVGRQTFFDHWRHLIAKVPQRFWFSKFLRRFKRCGLLVGIRKFVGLRLRGCYGIGHLGGLGLEQLAEILECRGLERFVVDILRQLRVRDDVDYGGLLVDVDVEAKLVVVSAPDVDLGRG
jgi:hypothetical protein